MYVLQNATKRTHCIIYKKLIPDPQLFWGRRKKKKKSKATPEVNYYVTVITEHYISIPDGKVPSPAYPKKPKHTSVLQHFGTMTQFFTVGQGLTLTHAII